MFIFHFNHCQLAINEKSCSKNTILHFVCILLTEPGLQLPHQLFGSQKVAAQWQGRGKVQCDRKSNSILFIIISCDTSELLQGTQCFKVAEMQQEHTFYNMMHTQP